MNRYFVIIKDETAGPYTMDQLKSMWLTGALNLQTPFMQDGTDKWEPMETMVDLLEHKAASIQSEPRPGSDSKTPPVKFPKSIEISDINMKFGSMVAFMIKWTIASIPAFIILAVIGFAIFLLVTVVGAGLFAGLISK